MTSWWRCITSTTSRRLESPSEGDSTTSEPEAEREPEPQAGPVAGTRGCCSAEDRWGASTKGGGRAYCPLPSFTKLSPEFGSASLLVSSHWNTYQLSGYDAR